MSPFLHLKNLKSGPPGGWQYTQPQSGYTMSSIVFYDLVKKVSMHRHNMNYPMGDVAAEVEAQICSRMSPEDQYAHCETGVRPVKSLHWTLVQRFLVDLVAWLKIGFEPVEQAEAERRAEICKTCPLNVGMHGCGSCRQTLDAVRETVMKLTTPLDSKLQACGVCGCELKTAVHVPLTVLQKGQVNLVFPDWCWQHH